MRPRKLIPAALGAALALVASACSSDSEPDSSAPARQAQSGSALALKGVCPDKVVIQPDWFPESEYGAYYNLVGPGYKIDANKKRITGPLVAGGQDTGVQIEIRTGGPVIGGQQVSAAMYADKGIHLGVVSTDEQIQNSARQPTLAVLAPLDISPLMIMWDPTKHPEFNTIADIGQSDTTVLYFQTDTYMQFLLGAGLLRDSQLDGSYSGAPDQWMAKKGDVAQGGFATSEPYIYANELPTKYEIDYQLVNDAGYPMYGQATVIRPEDKEKLAPCLEKLVPILQRSQVDFINSPERTNALIVKTVKAYKDFWTYSDALAQYSARTMKELGIVGNGANRTLGDMEESRVKRMLDVLTPIFAAQRKPVKEGLRPGDLYTNEFIDEKIGLETT